ncbi:MAG: DUF4442 domain-containing protein [Bacteroidetes bacterium]|jgi:acyl-coenzyme A thioesterase PaaI-like protein|nr:MAG: DUF4442 domain-containing protein [Bacteroidota bacterium]TAE61409.1 MAG: DUF4442 domain-containing protein [Bacteroidota bacterium]TAF92977.1 MAG: DUF4442 domain-containing protein [Bacteroidota bacterium]
MPANFSAFQQKITNPLSFTLFLATQLPTAWFCGIKVQSLTPEQAQITVRQKWFNKNPFRSIYFAVLSMAAEIATGVLAMGHLYQIKPGVSMLVTEVKSNFYKKATGKIVFTCTSGNAMQQAITQSIETGQGTQAIGHAVGTNEEGVVVAEFWFTWSFKAKV